MHLVVVAPDVVEVDRVAEAWRLEQLTGTREEHRHRAEFGTVALEMLAVGGFEADEGREQAYVRFGDRVADQVMLSAETIGEPVEATEEALAGQVVGPLGASEAETPLLTSAKTTAAIRSISGRR
jgi:hypothetical protein